MPNRQPDSPDQMHEQVERGVYAAGKRLIEDSDWARGYWSGAVQHGVPALGRMIALWLGGLVVVILLGWAGWQLIEIAIQLKGRP